MVSINKMKINNKITNNKEKINKTLKIMKILILMKENKLKLKILQFINQKFYIKVIHKKYQYNNLKLTNNFQNHKLKTTLAL